MKQVKPSVIVALMLCILIGYFEPANAAKLLAPSGDPAYMALNTTTVSCPFWPNPFSPTSVVTAISTEDISGGIIQNTDGKVFSVSVIATGQSFPLGVVQNNNYFVPDVYDNLTGTTLSIPSLPDGNYVLTVYTKSGNTYTSKIAISSK